METTVGKIWEQYAKGTTANVSNCKDVIGKIKSITKNESPRTLTNMFGEKFSAGNGNVFTIVYHEIVNGTNAKHDVNGDWWVDAQ